MPIGEALRTVSFEGVFDDSTLMPVKSMLLHQRSN